MEEEFEIEKNEKMIKVKIRRPKREEAKQFKKESIEIAKKLKAEIKLENTDAENIDKKIDLSNELDLLLINMIIKLDKSGTFKTVEDFEDVADEDIGKICAWVYKKVRIDLTEGFLQK
jgi:Cu2+-containing amine oxidase